MQAERARKDIFNWIIQWWKWFHIWLLMRFSQRNMKLIKIEVPKGLKAQPKAYEWWMVFEFEQSIRNDMNICNSIEPISIIENWKLKIHLNGNGGAHDTKVPKIMRTIQAWTFVRASHTESIVMCQCIAIIVIIFRNIILAVVVVNARSQSSMFVVVGWNILLNNDCLPLSEWWHYTQFHSCKYK